MGLHVTSMRMVEVPDWKVIAEDLDVRTGLSWTFHEHAGSKASPWDQCFFVVERFHWVAHAVRPIGSNIIEVHLTASFWPWGNYDYWQLLATLHARGGVSVSPEGEIWPLKFPYWISRKWHEMPWWYRYPSWERCKDFLFGPRK